MPEDERIPDTPNHKKRRGRRKTRVMPNVPNSTMNDQITWFENHLSGWQATPTSFGVSAAQVTSLASAVATARYCQELWMSC